MKITIQRLVRRAGFTLLEVVLAVTLMGLIIGAVYNVANSSLAVSEEVQHSQERVMQVHAFVELMRRTFEQMPGNAKFTLLPAEKSSNGIYPTELALQEYPLAFSWSGVEKGAKAVVLKTERDSRGALMARVYYLNAEQAQDYDQSPDKIRWDEVQGLTLIEDIKFLQWYLRTEEHDRNENLEEYTEWDPKQKGNLRPAMAHMYLQFYDNSEPIDQYFWIPVMANPETYTRAGAGGAGGTPPPGGQPGPGGAPNVRLDVPGGGPPPGGRGNGQGGPRPGGPGAGGPRPGGQGGPGPGGPRPGGLGGRGR